jgi:hypothetical protein
MITDLNWNNAISLGGIFPIIQVIVIGLYFEETPEYLYSLGEEVEAEVNLKQYYKIENDLGLRILYDDIMEITKYEQVAEETIEDSYGFLLKDYLEIFKTSLYLIVLWISQGLIFFLTLGPLIMLDFKP